MDPTLLAMLLGFLPSFLGGSGTGGAGGGTGDLLDTLTSGAGAPTGAGTAGGGSMLGGGAGVPIIGGLVSGIIRAVAGPGAGQTRRMAARSAVAQSPALTALHNAVLASVPVGRGSMSSQLRSLLANPSYRAALLPWVQEADRLGGMGVAQGPRANYIGDIIKWVTTGETAAPKRYIPTLADLNLALGINAPGVGYTSSPYTPAPGGVTYNAPVGVAAPVIPRSSYWSGFAYSPGGF